ncbi:MAG: DNA alkylation repair protein [Muribaculaceae bacterium]|nr:DNA alkylation repair protein [Muribaculaceae bacterium]
MTQEFRKEFFAYRNGIVAELLRSAGDPHTMIMGCQLADVIAITSRYEKDARLAQALWDDAHHRECRMAATMLYPIENFDMAIALAWCQSVESTEIADILCHRLLRHLDYATQLWQQLHDSDQPLAQYTAYRLLLNLMLMNRIEKTAEIRSMIKKDLTTAPPSLRQLLESIAEEMNGNHCI